MIMGDRKISSKKIGIILMLVFILGFGFFTIYSRGYVQNQKPLVYVAFPESASLAWTYETRTTIEKAASVYAANGVEWTIEVHIPLSAFQDYMSELHRVSAVANTDVAYIDETLSRIDRQVLDDGGYIYVFSYSNKAREDYGLHIMPGEGVTVHLEYTGLDSFDFMIPFSAIHHDPFFNEDYIFTVHRRNGAWGFEYYVSRHNITYGSPERIGYLANILSAGLDEIAPIVYQSEGELYDGAPVRLWD